MGEGAAPADIRWLNCGALRAAVRPDVGGSVAGLWQGEQPLLRSVAPDALEGPRQSACFPLLPYSNRIGYGRLTWDGATHPLQLNFGSHPHPLHGVGWRRPWTVTRQEGCALSMRLSHTPDADWPYAFEAEQTLALDEKSLSLHLRLRNTDRVDQPVGLGWHPYFPRRADSAIELHADRRWESGPDKLPQRVVGIDGVQGPVAGMDLDHCLGGWDGVALITDECHRLRLTADTAWVVVFTPPQAAHFCVEPVSHANNAVQHADPASQGLVRLRPGAEVQASMRLEILPPTP